MTLGCGGTGSTGNAYYIESGNEILLLDAGIPLAQIKEMIDYKVGNVVGAIITHSHLDHSSSAIWLKAMGIPVWKPYEDTEHKRLKSKMGNFEIISFDVPHNGCENRGFVIRVEGQTICYMTDMELCPYSLATQNIDTMIIECNYMSDLVSEDLPNFRHKVLGHCELSTTIGILEDNLKSLKHVILVHMGLSTLDRKIAMERIREVIPKFIDVSWAKAGMKTDISEIPF